MDRGGGKTLVAQSIVVICIKWEEIGMTKGMGCIFLCLLLAACGAMEGEDPAQRAGTSGIADEAALIPVAGQEQRILAFGDSLFAGYGVDKDKSYPAMLERALRAQGVNARVTNAGVSGDTSAAGLQRFAFTLDAQERAPDLVIIELGGNDLLRRIVPEQTRANIAAMLEELQSRQIPALVMGMRAPPNFGPEYQGAFDRLYPDLAREYDADLVPFFLESIYQTPALFQSDRIHPTEEGIEQLVAATRDQVAQTLADNRADDEANDEAE